MPSFRALFALPAVVALNLFAVACDVEGDPNDNEGELITTVELTFSPLDGGDDVVATWADVDLDGTPDVDAISLADDTAYTLSVRFLNEAQEPADDITEEVDGESAEHQVFITGDVVDSEATGANADAIVEVRYADTDAGGLPVGLTHDVQTLTAGDGTLTVTLRHLPEQGGAATKVAGLAEDAASSGLSSLPGDSDADVDFDIAVQ